MNCVNYSVIVSQCQSHTSILCFVTLGLYSANHISALQVASTLGNSNMRQERECKSRGEGRDLLACSSWGHHPSHASHLHSENPLPVAAAESVCIFSPMLVEPAPLSPLSPEITEPPRECPIFRGLDQRPWKTSSELRFQFHQAPPPLQSLNFRSVRSPRSF